MPLDLLLTSLDNFIEAAQEVMIDVKKELNAPFLLVRKHCLDKLVRLINDSEVAQLLER